METVFFPWNIKFAHTFSDHADYQKNNVMLMYYSRHKCKYCDYQGTHVDNINRHIKSVHEIKMGKLAL